jgi:hypothetical protein
MDPALWYRIVVVGWFAFFGVFMGLDALVWVTRNPRIPTFSRVVCYSLPWWVVLPLTAVLLLHFAQIYIDKR